MKAFIHYVKGHRPSEKQAEESLASFRKQSWDASIVEGVTPETLDDTEFDVKVIKNGRLLSMQERGDRVYLIKKSCLTNHYRLWKKCIELNQQIAFIEHDAIAIAPPIQALFRDICILNIEYAFKTPSILGTITGCANYTPPPSFVPTQLPRDYPLQYYKNNEWQGYNMMPGTAAYAVTPSGAKKLLEAAYTLGVDQSDFFINSYNVNIDYITPSPVKFNTKNLNLSHTL